MGRLLRAAWCALFHRRQHDFEVIRAFDFKGRCRRCGREWEELE